MSPPTPLHDGKKPVRRISVLALFRDNGDWIPAFAKQCGALENTYDTAFEYFFYENDSKDRTVELLREFLQNRDGNLLSETLNGRKLPPLTSLERMEEMARCRNALLQHVRPLRSDWTLLIDTQTTFHTDVLAAMFAIEPVAHGIGMITPYGEETGRRGHYYDTWAFLDRDGRCHWPRCVFASCRPCRNPAGRQCKANGINDNDGPTDVNAAFAGFALVETALINDPRVRWATRKLQPGEHVTGGLRLPKHAGACEHWAFCEAIRTLGCRVVVLPRVKIQKTRKPAGMLLCLRQRLAPLRMRRRCHEHPAFNFLTERRPPFVCPDTER